MQYIDIRVANNVVDQYSTNVQANLGLHTKFANVIESRELQKT